jgi:hypothetical protein
MSLEQKRCKKCGEIKPFDAFGNHKNTKDGKRSSCKKCANQYNKAWHKANPEKQREANLKCVYGITIDIYNQLLNKQNYRCALCGTDTPGGNGNRFHVDHNHQTGEVRGLLCYQCNVGLGHLKDSPKLLKRAIQYLEDNGHYGEWTD